MQQYKWSISSNTNIMNNGTQTLHNYYTQKQIYA